MRRYESVAKSAEEAIEDILKVMKVSIEDIDIEIDEVNKGLFGFLKQKEVRVVATLKEGVPDVPDALDTVKPSSTEEELGVEAEKPEAIDTSEPSKEIPSKEGFENQVSGANPELIRDAKDVIRDFIGQIASNIERDIEVNVKEGDKTINIDVKGEDLSILIGRHGKTLDSIRYLLSLMVNRGRDKDDIKRIVFDVEGYRKKRDNSLERLARNVATKVIKTKREIKLDPMNPYERRIVHSALQRNKLVTTRSEGEEPFRSVIIYLK